MITQALKSGRPAPAKKAPRLNSEAAAAVASAKSSLASQKGYPWSYTEYNCALASMMEHLASQHGDAAAQELLRQMDSVPIKGGRFNPWSGD